MDNFLKQIDTSLHKQYVMEKFKEGFAGGRNFVVEEPKFEFKKPVFKKKLDLPRADEVPIAKEYLEKRKLDPSKFYFAYKFKEWTNAQKQTFDTIGRDESRIIIPMYDEDKILIGFQGRSLGPNSVKYITVMINEDAPKIYGLDQARATSAMGMTCVVNGSMSSSDIRKRQKIMPKGRPSVSSQFGTPGSLPAMTILKPPSLSTTSRTETYQDSLPI